MKKIIILTSLFLSVLGNAQKYELGKVTIDELNEKKCPSDTSAVAAVLFSIGKSYFSYTDGRGFELVTEKSAKIKIYKKEGYDYANQSMMYYTGGNGDEKVLVSKAVTYNLVNNKIEKTKLNGDGKFTEKVNKYWSKSKITLPNVKEGSIIEFQFQVTSSYIDIPDWQFQTDIPVVYSEFTTAIPEYYIYNTQHKGYLIPKVDKQSLSKSVTITNKERVGTYTSQTYFSADNFSYLENKTKYVLENIPALKEENYVNNINNYRATVLHELSGKRFPNRPYENFTTDWDAVVKSIYDSDNFGNELKKTGYFEKDIDALLNGVTAQNDRIAAVFNYVKSNMNWNEYYGIYCDDGVKKAYSDKKGNVAEINLMLISMLRYAGFDVNPVIISTRSHGISLFPSKSAYNYVIAGLELDNQIVLMDATHKYALPNILPIRDLNWFGRIIRKNGSSAEIDLMPKINSKDVVNVMAKINEKGEIAGKIRDQYFDYNALLYREANNSLSKESYIERIEKSHSGLEIGEYNVQNSNDLSLPIVENYDFMTNNAVEIIGDKMYVSPFMFFATDENPFKQETREYPIDFVYPNQNKFMINLTIPDGYVVETLPAPKAVAMPDELANFKYNISNNGNQVQILYTSDINQSIISNEYYEALKSFYKEIVDKQTEKIVLKKA